MNKKIFKYSIRIVLSLFALYVIYTKVDISKAWFYLQNTQWGYIFLAFLAFFTSKLISAFRINTLYRSQGLNLSEKLNAKLTFLGMFYNLFIPLVGGEGYKVYWVRKNREIKTKKLISAALLDRASGVTALSLLTVLFFMWSTFTIPYKNYFPLLIPIIYFVHYLVVRFFFSGFLSAWFISNLYSLFVQLLQLATSWFIILAMGMEERIIEYLFTFLLSCFAFVLPMIAAREMAFVFGAEYLGLNPELSLAISILFYLALAFNSLLGSYFTFYPDKLQETKV